MTGLDLIAGAASLLALAAAWRFRWLSGSGMVAAVVVGAALWVGAGAAFLLLLLFFFATASALSRSLDSTSTGREDRTGRTAAQVFANGGVATAAALTGLSGLLPGAPFAVAGALAAAMADTWATELGTSAGWPTRLISSGRLVPPGASGGVSWPGTAAACVASALFGLVAAALVTGPSMVATGPSVVLWPTVTVVAGALGMTIDSLLGATLEGRLGWMNNQTVNLVGTAAGALAGWATAAVLGLW